MYQWRNFLLVISCRKENDRNRRSLLPILWPNKRLLSPSWTYNIIAINPARRKAHKRVSVSYEFIHAVGAVNEPVPQEFDLRTRNVDIWFILLATWSKVRSRRPLFFSMDARHAFLDVACFVFPWIFVPRTDSQSSSFVFLSSYRRWAPSMFPIVRINRNLFW